MRSRLGMSAYYQKKGGWGAGPLTLPGGIGYQYTYLLTFVVHCRGTRTGHGRAADRDMAMQPIACTLPLLRQSRGCCALDRRPPIHTILAPAP